MFKPTQPKLSKKQVRQILENNQWIKDVELSKKFWSEVYRLENGKILIVDSYNGTGKEFTDDFVKHLEDSYDSVSKKAEYQKGNEHILADNFPYQENFITDVSNLVNQLAERFFISRSLLDNSLKSLRYIDTAIKRIGQLECLKEEIFPLLIAYVGEVIKQQTQGHWQMRCVTLRSIVIWEPLIIVKNGREFLPFYIIYNELYEDLPFSLEGAVTGYISEGFQHCSINQKNNGL